MPMKFRSASVFAATMTAFACTAADAAPNTFNSVVIEKQYKACSIGRFVVHHYNVLTTDADIGVYEAWWVVFDSVNPIMNGICSSFDNAILNNAERDFIRKRISGANACADQEAASMTFREFARAREKTVVQIANLNAIQEVITYAQKRNVGVAATKNTMLNTENLLISTLGMPGKAVVIGEAILSGAANFLLKEMAKEKAMEELEDKALEKINDPYADKIREQYDLSHARVPVLPESSYDCQ